MKIQSRAKGPRVRRARAVKCHTSRDGLSEAGNSHTKRYGQRVPGEGRGKPHGMGNPSCAEAQESGAIRRNLFCIDHFPFHFPSSISSISLSLSLGALAIGVWSTMADGTITLPDDLLSSKAPEEL